MSKEKHTYVEELSFIQTKLKNLKIPKEKNEVNILLLGETGVGKSTFINSFFNYITSASLYIARSRKIQVVIPSKFTVTDENYKERIVQVGKDHNECIEVGQSATQACRSYVYPIEKDRLKIRLIDTPGVGDTRGIEQDNINFENILSYIAQFKQLDAICILLKPNNARLTVMFEFCIKQLLSRLEKSASQNLIFIFTNTRSTFYRPGETLPSLKMLLGPIGVKIPCEKRNIFCTDNEAFRFLAALKNGVNFSKSDFHNYSMSWKQSADECLRMLMYIIGDGDTLGLAPHEVQNTISINEARRLIIQLSKPLAEIAQLIQDNIRAIDKHKENLNLTNSTLSELREKLYIPIVDLKVIALTQPTTVCTSSDCSQVYQVGGIKKWHYKQRCHDPCYLSNVPKEIIGSPELINCGAMSNGECINCSCRFQVHMHIYYDTETFENKLVDKAIKTNIKTKQAAHKAAQDLEKQMSIRLLEFKREKDFIIKTTAKFACFLKTYAIAPYNDAYKAYLEYLIDREKSMNEATDFDLLKQLEKMLAQYTEEKNTILNAIARTKKSDSIISADDIKTSIESLYLLQHYGHKIKELFQAQNSARNNDNRNIIKEYVFDAINYAKKLGRFRNKYSNKGKPEPKQSQAPNASSNQGSTNLIKVNSSSSPIPSLLNVVTVKPSSTTVNNKKTRSKSRSRDTLAQNILPIPCD